MASTRPDTETLNRWFSEHLRESKSVSRATRGVDSSGVRASFSAEDFQQADAVLSVHFADGSVFHTTPQDWLERVAAADPGTPTRGTSDDGRTSTIELPFELRPRTSPLTRAAGGNASDGALIERYSLARLTEPTTLDRVYGLGAWAADQVDELLDKVADSKLKGIATASGGLIGAKLCFAFENSQLNRAVGQTAGALLYFPPPQTTSSAGDSLPTWLAWPPKDEGEVELADDPVGPRHRWSGWPPGDEVVLFLHGTASSTLGSFGALSEARDAKVRKIPGDFESLRGRCRLLAWEHRSLSASPVQNALDAARALEKMLPEGSRLHLVSHSRGGMVGDLLSLAFLKEPERRKYRALFDVFYGAEKCPHPDQPLLPALFDALDRMSERGLKAGTFVRVASPSRGTLLADRRTDLFLSLLLRCVGLAGGVNGNPWYETFNGFVRSFVAARADARLVPGLEAMIPGSALTLALNAMATPPEFQTPLPELPGALRVIAGDAVASGLGGLFTLLGDAFYGLHDHDFVVHTHSMFGGFRRQDAKSLRLERKGVHHLGYFKADALSRPPLFNALVGDDRDFRSLDEDERITRGFPQLLKLNPLSSLTPEEWQSRWDAESRLHGKPYLVVLPGIMGSELTRTDGDSVWIGLGSILSGRLTELALDPARPEKTTLKASALMSVAYERLLVEADREFRVLAWPYDWRRSLDHLGGELRTQLNSLISLRESPESRERDDLPPPIHVLAHSMGGLVARAALFRYNSIYDAPAPEDPAARDSHYDTETWQILKKRGGRLLMLGTPNLGSYAPVQLLAQQHRLSQLLALVARDVSSEDLARYGSGFDGLLQMLPAERSAAAGDLFLDATWQALQRQVPSLQRPDPDSLRRAAALRNWRDKSFLQLREKADPRVMYVAGAGLTPVDLALPAQPGGALGFVQSLEGDGTVPWLSRLAPAQTWYADCSHGDLGDHTSAFAAYFELLRQGSTQRLSQLPPLGSQGAAFRSAAGPRAVTLQGSAILGSLPSLPEDLAAFALGVNGDREDRSRVRLPEPPIEISLVHGSLDYARFPLIVGHNLEEHLAGGTRRVDEKLGGQLQRMIDLKLFVGDDRTSAYLRPPARDHRAPAYPGALVLGLGAIGALTPSSLSATVTRGVLRYAFEHLTRDCWVEGDGPLSLRLSTLLVGTHMQAVSFRDSLAGVIMGVWNANQHLARELAGRAARVVELEIIEIYEHNALDAAYELDRLLRNRDWAKRVVWPEGTLQTRTGGLFGYRRRDDDSVWQRLIVAEAPPGGLAFELISERARVEATQVRSNVASLSSFIQQLSDDGVSAADPARDEERGLGQVFFQLLLPQALKDRMTNFEQTVLVVDDGSAGYPWELMTPPEDVAGDTGDAQPLAVQAGMVRQRVTRNFRALPQTRHGFDALIVGAPSSAGWKTREGATLSFPELPGALIEAAEVGALLEQDKRPWRVTSLTGPGVMARQVRMALLARPYRLLHLSAHGAYKLWVANIECCGMTQKLEKTGVLLSDQEVLGAEDVEQMGNVPEFVFINCCYLGRDPGRSSLAPLQRNDPEMAAGLALKFIEMGAKAVIAAGWQVQDEAGRLFAQTLYEGLLGEGLDFGSAVLQARRSVRDNCSGNTWGAYQCYGDPNWRFAANGGGGRTRSGSSHLRDGDRAKSPGELATQLMKVSAVAGDKPRDVLRHQLRDTLDKLENDPARKDWLRQSGVASALSAAWRELGEYRLSLAAVREGAQEVLSQVSMRDIEAASNSLARIGTPSAIGRAHALLNVLDDLERRLADADASRGTASADAPAAQSTGGFGRAERLSLRGSIELRRVAALLRIDEGSGSGDRVSASAKKTAAASLIRGAEYYLDAYLSARERVGPADRRCFALANAVLCAGLGKLLGAKAEAALSRLNEGPGNWSHDVQALLEELKANELSAEFWHYTGAFELRNAQALLRFSLGQAAKAAAAADAGRNWLDDQFDQARRQLEIALVRWPSPAEKDSIAVRLQLMRAACIQARASRRDVRKSVLDHVQASMDLLNRNDPAQRA